VRSIRCARRCEHYPGALAPFDTDLSSTNSVAILALSPTHVFSSPKTTLIVAVIVSGAFIGLNNTLTTQAVMLVSPVERPIASASYDVVPNIVEVRRWSPA
jgi:nucleoside recognition membrane protein YjiH